VAAPAAVMLRHLTRAAALLVALALLGLGTGFWWFVTTASRPSPQIRPADGIVVLTGGPERVETGLRLLAAGRAPRLLISGLGGGAELAELARRAGLDPAPFTDRVTLGREATSTRTNAVETAQWAERHHIRSLLVVTAGFHMPRAIVELHRRMPSVALLAAPVPAGATKSPSLRALAEEYIKWLAAEAGLTGLAAPPDPRPRPGHAG